MNRRKLSMVFLVFALLISLLAGCSGASKQSGVLRVGVRDDIMNFSYLNKNTGKYYGLEIDLAYKLADELGYKDVEFITVKPEDRKEMLLDGKVDCLIATYSIAESRLKNFDFSPAYYSDYSRVLVEKSSGFTTIEQLLSKNIGTLDGANTAPVFAQKLVELGLIPEVDNETFDAVTFVKMGTYDNLDTALEDGSVDAICMDGCIARNYLNDDRMLLDEVLHEESYGVATQKDSKLSKPVANAVQKLLDDKTIEKLIDKWN